MLLRSVLLVALLAMAPAAFSQDRIQVVTTTTDLRSLAEAVGGDRVVAVSLIPPNLDAEEYQPKPQDVLRLKQAQLLVRVGLDYDLWLDRPWARARRLKIGRGGLLLGVASCEGAVRDGGGRRAGGGADHPKGGEPPHFWLKQKKAEINTANILEALARIDPANARTYEANRRAFLTRLNAKLTEWESRLSALKSMPIVAYHNSWPYFARRFRLDVIGFIETKPGVPPSASHLAAIVRDMRARGARFVLREPHEPERDVAFVASRAGAQVVTLAASVGALPGADDYISLFDVNVEALTTTAAKR